MRTSDLKPLSQYLVKDYETSADADDTQEINRAGNSCTIVFRWAFSIVGEEENENFLRFLLLLTFTRDMNKEIPYLFAQVSKFI